MPRDSKKRLDGYHDCRGIGAGLMAKGKRPKLQVPSMPRDSKRRLDGFHDCTGIGAGLMNI